MRYSERFSVFFEKTFSAPTRPFTFGPKKRAKASTRRSASLRVMVAVTS